MIFNDIADKDIDSINNPTRPLVTGEINVPEACFYSVLLTIAAEIINQVYLPSTLRPVITFSIVQGFVYTPVLKHIPLIKNLSCAWLVATAILFSGYAAQTNQPEPSEFSFGLLSIAAIQLFLGSFHNEVLLDMCDREGDAQHGILTIPAMCGPEVAWFFAVVATITNIGFNTFHLSNLVGGLASIPYGLSMIPMAANLVEVSKQDSSKAAVIHAVRQTTIPLFVSLGYLCLLATIHQYQQ
jgi:geranylgeranylglycerol-phosphate geranylgeranyltransferase